VKEAVGVVKATPAVAEELVPVGAFHEVIVTPPAVYPVPDTSPVVLYAVVEALYVAEDKYKAALKVSAVVAARTTPVPKLCCPVSNSFMNEVHIACVLAMITP
jgi:hypothetical protein